MCHVSCIGRYSRSLIPKVQATASRAVAMCGADPVLDRGAVRLDSPVADRDERVRVEAVANAARQSS
jgi:hypothetical protein